MYTSNDPSRKAKPQQPSKQQEEKKKAFREGMQDNSTQDEAKDAVTNASCKIVNTQEEDIVVNKQDKQD